MNIIYDFNKVIGKIRAMHGIGQPPINGMDCDMFHYVKEAGIPYSRLHDVGGVFGNNMFVDIHNIFRNFDADVEDENSYDFAFTDILMKELQKINCEPIYRLGETIENYHYIKAYRIFPPKSAQKWARICEHIIKHYNYGWANGFHMNIQYWEIWNEPDNGRDVTENQMWHGSPEEFYELYSVTAKHLKSLFGDEIKVGGYATCGFRHILSDPKQYGVDCERVDDECYSKERSKNFLDFFEGFFEYIKKNSAPIDFLSWHSYLTTDRTVVCSEYLDRRLNELGYGSLETHVNEWNNVYEDREDKDKAEKIAREERGTSLAAAKTLSMMCAMQNTKTKILCYYDARLGISYYGGMFNPLTREPFPLYYAFVAFNELYKLGNQVDVKMDKVQGIYSLAAKNGNEIAVVIVNTSEISQNIKTNLDNNLKAFTLEEGKNLEEIEINNQDFSLLPGAFMLIRT